MNTKRQAETTLDASELHRLSVWYRSFIADKFAAVETADVVLSAKLGALSRDIEDRGAALAVAARERAARQHVGVERRNREATPIVHKRIVRPVAVAA